MIAVDTNILVRLLTDDDPKQAADAGALVAANPVWIAKTVLLETIWVLRSQYGFGDHSIRQAIAELLGLDNIQVEDPAQVAAALILGASDVDFADALHLCSRPPAAVFASFDRAFIRRARRAGIVDVAAVGS